MRILVVGANGRTGRHVVAALQARPERPFIRGLVRRPFRGEGVESVEGDLDTPADRRRAVEGMDVVIHYGPTLDPRETSMGTGMIDAAIAAGVSRFIYISVIHPQIDDLMNHQAKLAVEAHLLDTDLDWTILRPQHYMQNIDVAQAVASGRVAMPYPVGTVLGHVDMADLAEVAAMVALEPGHSFASYDIAADEHLSVTDICDALRRLSGAEVQAAEISPDDLIRAVKSHHPLSTYAIEAIHRLFGYYARRGIAGNARVLTWLLGRQPTTFDAYAARCLKESATG